ncbi:MAG: hypothetical protein IPF96_12105 [Rhodobacter sp.]|nr:hypothetical protein [Rhodobacter sp.]
MPVLPRLLPLSAAFLLLAGPALAFDIGFNWSGRCTNGKPPTVAAPPSP